MSGWLMSTNGPHRISKSGLSSAAAASSSASGTYCRESLVVYLLKDTTAENGYEKKLPTLSKDEIQEKTHGPEATTALTPGPEIVRRSATGSGLPSTIREALTIFSPPRDYGASRNGTVRQS